VLSTNVKRSPGVDGEGHGDVHVALLVPPGTTTCNFRQKRLLSLKENRKRP
jgi:hypothetical protein